MLKVAVISDTHLGFDFGGERSEDSFKNLEQAFSLALKEEPQPQLILLCGDIFHERIPRQEVLGRAIELFSRANKQFKSRPELLKHIKGGNIDAVKKAIPPIIAIWGTHERRASENINPVQLLEKAGLISTLHAESVLVECGYDRLGIHGLSGVPEMYARDALKGWDPKPFEECYNVLLLHQNIKEVMPPVDYALSFSDLPKDFMVLSGHIHNKSEHKHPVSKNPIIVVGSTVSTQMQKIEAETQKGFYIIEFGREKYDLRFVPIKTRPFFYKTIDVGGKKPADILFALDQEVSKVLKEGAFSEVPAMRIKLKGQIAEGFRQDDLNFGRLRADYAGKVILSLDKSDLESCDAAGKSTLLNDLREKKLSIDDIGLKFLADNLKMNIDANKLTKIFQLLSDEEFEAAEQAIGAPLYKSNDSNAPENAQPVVKSEYITSSSAPAQAAQSAEIKNINNLVIAQKSRDEKMSDKPEPELKAVGKARPAIDAVQLQMAESGISALGFGSGKSRQLAKSTAPIFQFAGATAPKSQPKIADLQTASLAKSGLSLLGQGAGNASKPNIRLRGVWQPETTARLRENLPIAAKAAPQAQPSRQMNGQIQEPEKYQEAKQARKDKFDLQKWLNKDYF